MDARTPPGGPSEPAEGAPAAGRPCRIALVGSSGGHLAHLMVLREFWQRHDRFWVTFETPDAVSQLAGERTFWCHHPTNRNIPNLLRNTWLAWRVLRRERPTMIVSAGAAVAVPFLWLGRLMGIRTVYIEVIDRLDKPSMTGRLVRPVAQHVLIQWPELQRAYPKARLVGPLL